MNFRNPFTRIQSHLHTHFYLVGSLIFAGFVNALMAWALFTQFPSSSLFLRGNSPWLFYLPCLLATAIALGCSAILDRFDSPGKRSYASVSLRVFLIFIIGSISLNLLTFLFVGYGQTFGEIIQSFMGQIRWLGLFLLAGVPLCLFLSGVYLAVSSALVGTRLKLI